MIIESRGIARAIRLASCAFILLIPAASALAHDPGISSLRLTASEGQLTVNATFSRPEIATLADITDRSALERLGKGMVEIDRSGSAIPSCVKAIEIDDSSNAVHFTLIFPAVQGLINVRSVLLDRLAMGHRQFATLTDGGGRILHEQLLDAQNCSFEAAISPSQNALDTFRRLLITGIEHILTGYDHLAFLLALLLAATSIREVTKIITSFTIAHSMTLAMAALDLVSIPSVIVEPMIAASIVFVGLENLLRREPRGRWMLTFAFGLIHGFGFASALREMGIGRGLRAAMPLLSFNLGVEAGQLAIAALVLPVIWMLRRRPAFIVRYAPACSLLIALAGGYWLLVRTVLR
jgi:hydrogenase/urease accessory protein HupE